MSWWDTLRGKPKPAPLPVPTLMDEAKKVGVDFSALWEEPEDASSLVQILTIVNTALIGLTLVLGFFHL